MRQKGGLQNQQRTPLGLQVVVGGCPSHLLPVRSFIVYAFCCSKAVRLRFSAPSKTIDVSCSDIWMNNSAFHGKPEAAKIDVEMGTRDLPAVELICC